MEMRAQGLPRGGREEDGVLIFARLLNHMMKVQNWRQSEVSKYIHATLETKWELATRVGQKYLPTGLGYSTS